MADALIEMTKEDLQSLTVVILKKFLTQYELDTAGRKAELVERLGAHIEGLKEQKGAEAAADEEANFEGTEETTDATAASAADAPADAAPAAAPAKVAQKPKDGKQYKIFVGGLSFSVSDDVFRKYFESWGTVTDSVVMKDRGFGFVTLELEEVYNRLLAAKGHSIDGKEVELKPAVPQKKNG